MVYALDACMLHTAISCIIYIALSYLHFYYRGFEIQEQLQTDPADTSKN